MTQAATTTTTPAAQPRTPIAGLVLARAIECAVLFAGVPLLIYFDILPLNLMMLVLGVFGVVVFVFLLLDKSFDRKRLWNTRAALRDMPVFIPLCIVGALLMFIGTLLHDRFEWGPELLFGFPTRNTGIYIAVMLLYPLFSVYPQELIYRAFFFHRYAVLFRTPTAMIIASALAFGWGHLIFENVLAVALSTAGGVLFAWTYHRSKSLAACWLEHAIYGDWLFTVGLGWYFFTGSV